VEELQFLRRERSNTSVSILPTFALAYNTSLLLPTPHTLPPHPLPISSTHSQHPPSSHPPSSHPVPHNFPPHPLPIPALLTRSTPNFPLPTTSLSTPTASPPSLPTPYTPLSYPYPPHIHSPTISSHPHTCRLTNSSISSDFTPKEVHSSCDWVHRDRAAASDC